MVVACGRCSPKYRSTDLNTRITIQRVSKEEDGQGGSTRTWFDLQAEWAKWTPLSGSQRFNAMRVGSEVRVRAIVRYRPDENGAPYYSGADRVVYLDRIYGIDAVIDVDGERRFLELQLTETSPS